MVIRRFTTVLVSAFLLAACATTQGLKTSRGQGEIRHYRTDFQTLWDASLWAFGANGLEIEELNEDQGYILAKKGGGLFSYGERVAIFIERDSRLQAGDDTEAEVFKVEVISKKKGKLNIGAKDWKKPVYEMLESRLPDSAMTALR